MPPPSFRGTVREGEQEFQVVGKFSVRKGLVGVGLVEVLAGRAEPPHGEGRHRHGRRPAMGPPRPPLADLWSLDRGMAAAKSNRVRLMSAPEENHTSCCAMRTGTHVTGVPLNDRLGVLATPLYRTARLSSVSERGRVQDGSLVGHSKPRRAVALELWKKCRSPAGLRPRSSRRQPRETAASSR